jgi:starch phosphorylase
VGPFQIVYAGKAHPNDQGGKDIIRRIVTAAREIGADVPVIYLPDYGLELAALLVAGVDLWLNTPLKPQEASGTSGMKAALNGVPSLSVLDGWWVEGHVEGVTGWAVGEGWQKGSVDADDDQQSLYEKLARNILPLYYTEPEKYVRLMQSTIALNGSFFTAERMVLQYAKAVYGLSSRLEAEAPRHPPAVRPV